MTHLSPEALGTLDVLCLVGPIPVRHRAIADELLGGGYVVAVGERLHPTAKGRAVVVDRLEAFRARPREGD